MLHLITRLSRLQACILKSTGLLHETTTPRQFMNTFIVHPLEKHVFVDDPGNDFLCKVCHRPRALHVSVAAQTIPSNIDPKTPPIRSARINVAFSGKLLTDKKIAEYQKRGTYAARAKYLQEKRDGNWKFIEGRPVYSP